MTAISHAQAGEENEKSKIAVAAESDLEGASVSLRAARARFILIFDDEGEILWRLMHAPCAQKNKPARNWRPGLPEKM